MLSPAKEKVDVTLMPKGHLYRRKARKDAMLYRMHYKVKACPHSPVHALTHWL